MRLVLRKVLASSSRSNILPNFPEQACHRFNFTFIVPEMGNWSNISFKPSKITSLNDNIVKNSYFVLPVVSSQSLEASDSPDLQ